MGHDGMSVYWRRRLVAAGILVGVLVLIAAVASGGDDDTAAGETARAEATPTPAPPEPILPDKRVVAYYGSPDDEQLGILGIGTPQRAGRRLLEQAEAYATERRPVQPAMELIATIATFDPGPDGNYRRHAKNAVIRRYLEAAREIDAILILDIQPGTADFFAETTRLERWLREPDVHLALDPEWRVTPGEVPGRVIGTVSAREVNATTAWLEQLIIENDLPPKLVILHQFTEGMLTDRDEIKPRDHLQLVINADGFGGREVKSAKYEAFQKRTPNFYEGFKLFFEEDVGLMKPRQVLRLKPSPDVVVYE